MIDTTLIVVAAALLVPIGTFVVECLLSALPVRRSIVARAASRPPAVVLIPAHDEEAGLDATLRTLMPTLAPGDRVLVVADNCNDKTADVARRHAADVVERRDPTRRGKGYALECGINAIAESDRVAGVESKSPQPVARSAGDGEAPTPATLSNLPHPAPGTQHPAPSPTIIFLDADCQVTPSTVDALARAVAATDRPVQGLNLSESDAAGVQAVSSLGFHFKNLVRPAGLDRIGVPCHLMGTGMALPWSLASTARFAGGNLVEDMQLGIDLAIAGHPTAFCRDALVTSRLPTGRKAFLSQRTRWEHGHLRTSLTQIPQLLRAFVARRDLRLLGIALDLTVPPFSMLVFAWLAALAATGVAAALGASPVPALMLAGAGVGIAVAVVVGWARHCRRAIPWTAFASIPIYMLRKLPIYLSFLTRRSQRDWVRTERETPA